MEEEVVKTKITSPEKIEEILEKAVLLRSRVKVNEGETIIAGVSEGSVLILAPAFGGKHQRIPDKVKISFVTEEGIAEFEGIVLEEDMSVRPSIYRLRLPEEVSILERRKHPRVKVKDKKFVVTIIREDGYSIHGTLKDIGGGGLSLVFRIPEIPDYMYPAIGEKIKFFFDFEGMKIEGKGRIVHYSIDPRSHDIMCGLSFVEVDDATRDVIREYLEREYFGKA